MLRNVARSASRVRVSRLQPAAIRFRSTMLVDYADDEYDDDHATWAAVSSGLAVTPCKLTVSKACSTTKSLASLGEPLLEKATYDLRVSVQGDMVVGFAEADATDSGYDMEKRAWGVSTSTGCLHHARHATEEGMLGVELAPQRMLGDADERHLHFELDMNASRVRLRIDDAPWVDMPVRVPAAVRPWVLVPGDSASDVTPRARLLACTEQAQTGGEAVGGLRGLASHFGWS